jgi:chemotaxis response regulator CheB
MEVRVRVGGTLLGVAREASDFGFSVVATGGIGALKRFSRACSPTAQWHRCHPASLRAHKSNLAEILQKTTAMPVAQVNETIKVEPNQVYAIPPAKQLTFVDGSINVGESERVRGRILHSGK